MIAGLQEIDAVIFYEINQPMFLGQPPRPDTGSQVFQRLGFAFPFERISHDGLDQGQRSQGCLPVVLNPPADVFSEFAVKYGIPSRGFSGRLLTQSRCPA